MIIDAHTSVPPEWLRKSIPHTSPFKHSTIEALLTAMKHTGVDQSVLFSVARIPDQAPRINDFIHETCTTYSDKFIGFANIYPPNQQDALDEIDRTISKLGMAGLKIHPIVQNFQLDHPSVPIILERAKAYDVPIIIHVMSVTHEYVLNGEMFTEDKIPALEPIAANQRGMGSQADPALFDKVFPSYNSLNLQSAHLGGITRKLVQQSNISFQTAGATTEGIEYAVRTVGADRITFGSDFPFSFVVGPERCMEYELQKVTRANISSGDKAKILGENIQKILKR